MIMDIRVLAFIFVDLENHKKVSLILALLAVERASVPGVQGVLGDDSKEDGIEARQDMTQDRVQRWPFCPGPTIEAGALLCLGLAGLL